MTLFSHPRRSPRLEVLEDRLALSTLAVSDVGQREGDLGTRLFEFTVRLSDPGRGPVTVRYETADGTALAADNDYEAHSGTLRFGPGQTSKTVAVRVNGDHLVEGDQTFFLRLSDARGAAIADGEGQGTIRNDDPGFLVDDFNDGNDDGWTRVDFTAGSPGGPGSFDAGSGAYRLSTAGAVPADDPSVGTVLSTWEGARGNAAFGNGIVRGKVRANTQGTTAGFLLRASDSPGTEHDYGFFGSSSFGTFYIERFDHVNGQTIIAMADPDRHPFVAGEDYYLTGGVLGEFLWLKAWKVGDSEPLLPTLVVRDDTFSAQEGTLLCAIAFFDPAAVTGPVQVDATFDDITFTPLPGLLDTSAAMSVASSSQGAPTPQVQSQAGTAYPADIVFALLSEAPGSANGPFGRRGRTS